MKKLSELFKESALKRPGIITDKHFTKYVRTQLKPHYWNNEAVLIDLAFTKMPLLKINDVKP